MKSSDIHIRAISQEVIQPSITKIPLKMTYLKCHSNFQGANELIWSWRIRVKNLQVLNHNKTQQIVNWTLPINHEIYCNFLSNLYKKFKVSVDPGCCFYTKMPYCRYRDSDYKDKMVTLPYFYQTNSYTWKFGLYIGRVQGQDASMPAYLPCTRCIYSVLV